METLKYNIYVFYVKITLALMILTQCQNVQEATGLKKSAPDAFSVQPLRGLEIPPGFQDTPSDQNTTAHSSKNPNVSVEKDTLISDRAEQSLLEYVQPFSQK